jgi:hypothetical protein
MPIDTSAINTIMQAYLAGRGIRERREAELTRQQERKEDIKTAQEHFDVQRKQAEAQFNLQTAIAEMNQQEHIANLYQASGGAIKPPGAKLQGTTFEDLQQGDIQDQPMFKEYSYTGVGGRPQTIQLPEPGYLANMELRKAEEKQKRETTARLQAQEPFDIQKFNRENVYEQEKGVIEEARKGRQDLTAHQYRMAEIEAQAKGQRETREAAKKDFTATAKRAALHPEMLDTMTPGDRDIVVEEILKNNYNWLPPVVKNSYDRLTNALASVEKIEKIPGFTGTAGALARNLGGDTTSLDLEVQGLKNLLTQDNLKLMRGLGHMSDNDVKIIQGALTALDVKNNRFGQTLKDVKKGIIAAIKELENRNSKAPVQNIDLSGGGGVDLGADFESLFPIKKPKGN